LAEEIVRLARNSYGRTTVITHYAARAVSRSVLEKEGTRHHADWELGTGYYRVCGEMLHEKAERSLGPTAASF
jgi:hypothetical protein